MNWNILLFFIAGPIIIGIINLIIAPKLNQHLPRRKHTRRFFINTFIYLIIAIIIYKI